MSESDRWITALGTAGPARFLLVGAVLVTVVLVLLIVGVVRLLRRLGGPRRAFLRLGQNAVLTARSFVEPAREYARYRRRARALATRLGDPAGRQLPARALADADTALHGGSYPVAASVARRGTGVEVVVCGRDPGDPPSGWRTGSRPTRRRNREPEALPPAPSGAERLLLTVGAAQGGESVVADWARGPAVLSVEGTPRAARRVHQALVAQLALHDCPVRVAAGVHPRFPGERLRELAERPEPGSVIACWGPSDAEAEALVRAVEEHGVRVLTGGGRWPGSAWVLHTDANGRVLLPAAGITADAGPLGRAVALALRGRGGGGGAGPPRARRGTAEASPTAVRRPTVQAAPEPAPVPADPAPEPAAVGADLLEPEPMAGSTAAGVSAEAGALAETGASAAPVRPDGPAGQPTEGTGGAAADGGTGDACTAQEAGPGRESAGSPGAAGRASPVRDAAGSADSAGAAGSAGSGDPDAPAPPAPRPPEHQSEQQ